MKCCEDVINKGDNNEDNFKEHKHKEQYHKEDNQMYPDWSYRSTFASIGSLLS